MKSKHKIGCAALAAWMAVSCAAPQGEDTDLGAAAVQVRSEALGEAPVILADENSRDVSLSAPVRAGSAAEIRFDQRTLYFFHCAPRYYLPNGFKVAAKYTLNNGPVQTVALTNGTGGWKGTFVPSAAGALELWFEESNDGGCFGAYPGNYQNMRMAVEPAAEQDVRRTVVYIFGETRPGQDMFIRGGIDHGYARTRFGYDCARSPHLCSLPIVHRNNLNETTRGWKIGDAHLDWYGAEILQASALDGTRPQGSPLDWTTNTWPASWGPAKTVEANGYGLDPMNDLGMHYWKLDVDMDCSRAVKDAQGRAWFELKSFISNGPGWESDVRQDGAPYVSNNHFAQCGKVNVFRRGDNQGMIRGLPRYPAGTSLTCDDGALTLKPGEYGTYTATVNDPDAVQYFQEQSEQTFEFTVNYDVPRTLTVTKELPWTVAIADDEQSMAVQNFSPQSDGGFLTSGPPGSELAWNGDALTLTLRGAKMLGSKAIAYYEIGSYTFADCAPL